jgi:neurotransmitter:Na+ symporter, NSS family
MTAQGENFGRRLAAALVMVGVAVGLGNVWRFPYMMGRYGGGAFLALYILAMVLFGVPALIAEWTLGRATGEGPPGAYVKSGLLGGHLAGWLVFVAVLMATSYYVVVIGWVLIYLVKAVAVGLPTENAGRAFAEMHSTLPAQVAASWAVLAACGGVLLAGVRRGIGRVSQVFVPVFFVLLLGLVVRAVTLPGSGEGLRYLLTFDPSAVTGQTLVAVVGQAAFSLALGGTFMVIYGSYLDPETRLLPLAVQTAGGDLLASLLAAFLVIPAVFAAGREPTSGPPLLFETLPVVFGAFPGGNALAAIFFFALGLVAFLSAVAAIEVLVAPLAGRLGWPRSKAIWSVVALEALLGIPSMVSLDYLGRSDLIWGSTMQPLGSIFALAAVAWGLDRGRALDTAGFGAGRPWGGLWIFWIRWVVPVAVLSALVAGWFAS